MQKIKVIFRSNLFKIASLNSFSIVLKIAIGFITSKFIALFVGPAGMALVGNFRNFLSSTQAVVTLGFETGIVKYVAENKLDTEYLKKIIATITIFLVALCAVFSLVIYFYSDFLNHLIFGNPFKFSFVFKVVALALPFYLCSLLLVSVINGLGCFKKVIIINCIGYLIGLFVSLFLIYFLKTEGALLAIIITPSLLFFVNLFYIQSEIAIFEYVKLDFFDASILKKFSSYSIMVFVSSIIGPVVLLVIRNNFIEKAGLNSAGFWEAISRISSYYMLFITTILSLYFLPKLSESKTIQSTNQIFRIYFKTILPPFGFGLLLVYLLRFYVISILFTKEFLPTEKLFFWQLLGDFFRAASYILAFQFYAKKKTTAFVISELLSLTVLYFSSIYFVNSFGFEGIVMAHCATYIIYFTGLLFYFRATVFDLKK